MMEARPLRIGITCYPSVGGSGILATSLGEELANRGHEVHFISYERPFRLPKDSEHIRFHPVGVSSYGLFRYPDYTLPLSVRLAEVSSEHALDIIHAHYAVPHATAALLARDMLPPHRRPKVVTTLHGTDTTLLGRDPGYGPAIRHALEGADGVTAVSEFLRRETVRLLGLRRPVEVIHNFFSPRAPTRTREAVREELGIHPGEVLVVHSSNLRPLKRVDLVLEAFARANRDAPARLVVLAGGDFSEFQRQVRQLGLQDRVLVRENVYSVEDYMAAADLGLFASESESFCLSILEAMVFGCPSVATRVGGIPEVTLSGETGWLVEAGDTEGLATKLAQLISDAPLRRRFGAAGRARAAACFSADTIVDHYVRFYRQTCALDSVQDGLGL